MFNPVSSNKLYVQIYNQIKEAIESGAYMPGDKLPSEKEFCRIFNVSRVPVREALCALELNGLVESAQGAGVYVCDLKPEVSNALHNVEPQEIIQARIFIEPEIARQAALHINDEEKVHLHSIIEEFRISTEAGDDRPEADNQFHMFIAAVCGNTLYREIQELLFSATEQKLWQLILSRTIATEKYRHQNYIEHSEIADAIINGQAELAHDRMKEHMEHLYYRYWG